MLELENIKPKIDYPCRWSYRIIAFDKELILSCIEKVFEGKADIESKQYSKHKKYVVINCFIKVNDDDERLKYFNDLVNQNGVVMVL